MKEDKSIKIEYRTDIHEMVDEIETIEFLGKLRLMAISMIQIERSEGEQTLSVER